MKIDRLIGILSILLQEDKTTAPELAEKFEVSRRTINRDIEDLCKAGIPVRTVQGTGGGISDPDIQGHADDPCRTEKPGQREREQLLRSADGKNTGGIF